MNKVLPFILDYYDREVSQMISKKYGFPIMDAYKKFMFSKTYERYHTEAIENAFENMDRLHMETLSDVL